MQSCAMTPIQLRSSALSAANQAWSASTRAAADVAIADVGRVENALRAAGRHVEGVDYAQDVEPWLGQRVGVALLPGTDGGEPEVVMALASTDQDAATQGIGKLAGDETAAPAIARILEQLPPDARGTVVVELPEAADDVDAFVYSWVIANLVMIATATTSLSALVVFLSLAALYDSWTVPLAVMLSVPVGVFGAVLAALLALGGLVALALPGLLPLLLALTLPLLLTYPVSRPEVLAGKLLATLRLEARDDPAAEHRALSDARRECRRWARARSRAAALLREEGGGGVE